jgi:glycerate 2-kinase
VQEARARLRALFDRAVAAVSADAVMPKELPAARGRLVVIAVGKGAGAMMRAATQRATSPIAGLIVAPPRGLPAGWAPPSSVRVVEGGHPVPTAGSVAAAELALEMAAALGPDDVLLALLSGGGSALTAAPAQGLTLAEKQAVTRSLLRSGATIAEINRVRACLSRVKGGRLAAAAWPARVVTWLISDVPGDDPTLVASGPTLPGTASLAEARGILDRYGIDDDAAARILADPANEPPRADPNAAPEIRILATARDALDAAGALARELGYEPIDLGDDLEGEARELAAQHASLASRLVAEGRPRAILSGGETTVTVTNPSGRGGRNLEYLLALAIALDGAAGVSALACDTDGIDGTEAVAGAMIFPDTLARARAAGLGASALLKQNNAFVFFEALGDLVVTGPTLTNVNDFRAILFDPAR